MPLSQIEKLFKKFKRRPIPTDLLFKDADRLLKAHGFTRRQPSGGSSHYIYTHPELQNIRLTIARDGNKIKKGYARNVVNAIVMAQELFGGGIE